MSKKKVIHWGGGAVTKGVCGASPSDRRQVVQTKSLVTCKRCKARIK